MSRASCQLQCFGPFLQPTSPPIIKLFKLPRELQVPSSSLEIFAWRHALCPSSPYPPLWNSPVKKSVKLSLFPGLKLLSSQASKAANLLNRTADYFCASVDLPHFKYYFKQSSVFLGRVDSFQLAVLTFISSNFTCVHRFAEVGLNVLQATGLRQNIPICSLGALCASGGFVVGCHYVVPSYFLEK
ncbi:hypothetical protein B0H10DRAFT_1944624 [Mycena sp. CBHHK59/15]|nr:hypothetical protein B0H10DRAFT_1944624 [Mycena sp. CBHHK59/15]